MAWCCGIVPGAGTGIVEHKVASVSASHDIALVDAGVEHDNIQLHTIWHDQPHHDDEQRVHRQDSGSMRSDSRKVPLTEV